MTKPLASGFKLSEGNFADLEEIWQVLEDAYGGDEIWQVAFKNCKKEDVHSWIMNVFVPRWKLPDITFYTITEESTGYDSFHYFIRREWKANCSRRIAGWTALQFPWVDRPLKEEELAIVNSHDMPSIEGLNMEVLSTFIECMNFAGENGYEPQTDYRKKHFSPVFT